MRVKSLFCALTGAILTLASCQDYYFETVRLETIKEQRIIVPAAKPVPADIIFIVDNSCSMEDEQTLLGESFQSFIRQIIGSGDYRIAIISTDVLNGAAGFEERGTTTTLFKSTHPFAYLDTLQDACSYTTTTHGCFRGAEVSGLTVISSTMAASVQVDTFRQNVALGSCGYGNESGLEALKLALENTAAGKCNVGFLRPDANLVLIFVSDEDDQLSAAAGTYVDFIKQYKPIEKVRVGVIAATNATGDAANCRVGGDSCGTLCNMRPPEGSLAPCADDNDCINDEYCTLRSATSNQTVCKNADLFYFDRASDRGDKWCSWCSYYAVEDCCSARAGTEYVNFARAVERAVTAVDGNITLSNCQSVPGQRVACLVDTICQANFSETLKAIARDLVSTDKYTLDPPACNPEGVVVRIGGKTLVYTEDYEIINDGAQLVLKGVKPGPDDAVEIFFVVDGCGE